MINERLSNAQARRIALAAQGFADRRPSGTVDIRHLRRVLRRTNVLQIDSVNVLVRAHYMPLFSRLGNYPTQLLERAAYTAPRELFEYWGHEASLLPVGMQPLFRWRMARAEQHAWGAMRRINRDHPDFVSRVREAVAEHGPLTARGIEEILAAEDASIKRRPKDNWGWNWGAVKATLEWLFWTGEVTAAGRPNFERTYDLTERVLPAEIAAARTPDAADAHRELMAIAAAALGVATETDLRDYFRLRPAEAREALGELVDDGTVTEVRVTDWQKPAYLHREARLPRRVSGAALLSPFDPLIWERDRTERLWDFRYRIEIYVPAAKRVHGYYVLPFLLDGRLVARVDLKADRAAGVLRVPAAWHEPHVDGNLPAVADALAGELRAMAEWLGLSAVAVPDRGDLAPQLARALSGNGTVETVTAR